MVAFLSYRVLAHLFARRIRLSCAVGAKGLAHPELPLPWLRPPGRRPGHLQKWDEIQAAVGQLLEVKPEFNLAFARRRLFYVKNPDQLAVYLDGLEKAGIPEQS
jgi:hypothetical protein